MREQSLVSRWSLITIVGLAAGLVAPVAMAQPGVEAPGAPEAPEFPPFAQISKGFEKVVSTTDGESFYTLWVNKKKGQMLAELPRGFENQKHFIALTVASGEDYAGLQAGDELVYWKRIDKRLMMIQPNLETKSTGDAESKSSVKRLFTDRVLLDVPIVGMGPSGQPVIDMTALLAGRVSLFFQGKQANTSLATIKSAKAFPENIEIEYEMPTAGGRLQAFHYSISKLGETPGFKPRDADERVGYFTTVYRDLGKFTDKDKWVRYINRWNLEKRDSRLKLSPPKQPVVFYIEHTVPVRYRRYIELSLTVWNKAFEKVGILGAIEVRQQDAETGSHMEKDPEDVRYNFIRWLSNDQGTAIGPSRVNPYTGEILDADIILTDGWIRHFWTNFNQVLPQIAMEGMAPDTLAWLDTNPQWDPRIRLAAPEQRDYLIAQRSQRGVLAYGGHALAAAQGMGDVKLMGAGSNEFSGLVNRTSQVNGLCMAAGGKAFDVAMMRMQMDALGLDTETVTTGSGSANVIGPDGTKSDLLDGVPEWFIGPLLTDLVEHEVGHTLGLRHNFKASTVYGLDKINSAEIKGKKAFTGSVMDYTPINMNIPTLEQLAVAKTDGEKKDGEKKEGPVIKPQDGGDYTMIDIGPYDFWAIEYGYTSGDPKDVLKRVAEPELVYGTDEDTGGPDPRARRYDFATDPLDYAKSQIDLARWHRDRLLEKYVKDGESWAKARRGYEMTLGMQTRSVSMMANWIGGALINRDRKGDPNARPPVTPVPAAQQRAALKFVIEQSFRDEAFGLSPELLAKMTADKWLDAGGRGEGMQEPAWPIHDRIAGIQATSLTMILNPTTLRRVYDNELRTAADQDMLTLPEVIDTVSAAVWTEFDSPATGTFTARKPMISSLRQNLQQEMLDRLIDLSMHGIGSGAASNPVQNLATAKLRDLKAKLDKVKDWAGLDPYTKSHVEEARSRIERALNAHYVINGGGGGFPGGFFGRPAEAQQAQPGIPGTSGTPDQP